MPTMTHFLQDPPDRPVTAREAVVLAAGNGRRLDSLPSCPKPVLPLCGRPLLAHGLDGLQTAGIERVHIVVGHGADAVRRCAGIERDGLDVRWLLNPRFDEPNGLSLLCARTAVAGPFVLVMADHLFDQATLSCFVQHTPPPDGGLLAVDRRIATIFDPDDATRVLEADGCVEAIGKGLQTFNAVDTGLFLLTNAAFEAMDESVQAGDASLTGGVAMLARRGGVATWDVGDGQWLDVDTPLAVREAERLLRLGRVGAAGGLSSRTPR